MNVDKTVNVLKGFVDALSEFCNKTAFTQTIPMKLVSVESTGADNLQLKYVGRDNKDYFINIKSVLKDNKPTLEIDSGYEKILD